MKTFREWLSGEDFNDEHLSFMFNIDGKFKAMIMSAIKYGYEEAMKQIIEIPPPIPEDAFDRYCNNNSRRVCNACGLISIRGDSNVHGNSKCREYFDRVNNSKKVE